MSITHEIRKDQQKGKKIQKETASKHISLSYLGGNPRLNNNLYKRKQQYCFNSTFFLNLEGNPRKFGVINRNYMYLHGVGEESTFFLNDQKRKTVSTVNNKLTTCLDLPL